MPEISLEWWASIIKLQVGKEVRAEGNQEESTAWAQEKERMVIWEEQQEVSELTHKVQDKEGTGNE